MHIKGVGTDIVSRDRFKIENIKFNEKYLSKRELSQLDLLNDDDAIDYLSGRWVAKESVVKASNKEILYSDIEILKSKSGKPEVFVEGNLTDNIHVSISHEKSYTIAFCIIEKV